MQFFETSAKSNQNVNETFTFLTKEILKGNTGTTSGSGKTITKQEKKKKEKCCG